MMNEMKIEYKDILDIEYALRRAELSAKREWDEVVQWKDDDDPDGGLLYSLRYRDVKELRQAQKSLRAIWKIIRQSDIEPGYSTLGS
jgi:hypothetical protein